VVWSLFFSLKSKDTFLASKKLPFPNQRELNIIQTLNVVEKDRLK